MTSDIKPFNPNAKLEIDIPADGESFQEWMDKVPFDPFSIDRPERTEKEREHSRVWMEILRKTAQDHDAGLLNREEFLNERVVAACAHRLGNFDFAARSLDDLMSYAEATPDAKRQDLFLKLILALEERQKYTHRSF